MDCNEARPLLDANADHELPAPDARRVQQHIESCEACRRESANLRAMSGALRTAPYHRAPESLRARIVAGLPGAESAAPATELPRAAALAGDVETQQRSRRASPRRHLAWLDRWLNRAGVFQGGQGSRGGQGGQGDPSGRGGHGGQGSGRGGQGQGGFGGFARPVAHGGSAWPLASGWLAALVVALCAVGVAVTLNLRRPAEFAPFADELVASHVRAQVSGRDIDVISTDRHTVKPWFNGRLDYSPPVEDLAASGFALEGGRLDYLAHQRVAVLVYRYRKHVIDVYVFPQTGGAGSSGAGHSADGKAPAALAQEGYSIAHWNAQGMTWWAITDAAPDALSGLEAALKSRLQGGSERTEGG